MVVSKTEAQLKNDFVHVRRRLACSTGTFLNKISASELSWKFVYCPLLVGSSANDLSPVCHDVFLPLLLLMPPPAHEQRKRGRGGEESDTFPFICTSRE